MASTLKSARDQIRTVWQALTPPTQTSVTYREVTGKAKLDGASAHRTFTFEAPGGGEIHGMKSDLAEVDHRFNARVRISTAGLGPRDVFDAVADEAMLLSLTINNQSSWPSGVRHVVARNYKTERAGSEDLDLVIEFYAEVEETDG